VQPETEVRPRSARRAWEERHLHDPWRWRRAIRSDPRRYRVYRAVVGTVGVLLLLLGALTGWLPGPGGIPLTLLGLAVLASEFHWAHRILQWARVRADRFTTWAARRPLWQRWAGAAAVFVGVAATITYGLTAWLGVPGWMPDPAAALLVMLPGVR